MSQVKDFYKKIAFSKELNPFHSLFSYGELQKLLQTLSIENEGFLESLDCICYMIASNAFYTQFTNFMKKEFFEDGNFFLGSIAQANKITIALIKKMRSQTCGNKYFEPLKLYADNLNGNVNISDSLDASIDTLDFIFSLLLYLKHNPQKNTCLKNQKNESFFILANHFSILKVFFEKVCFENNVIIQNESEKKTFSIVSKENRFLLKYISTFRMQQLCTQVTELYFVTKEYCPNFLNRYVGCEEIANCQIKKGNIYLQYCKSDKYESLNDWVNLYQEYINLYYPFLPSECKRNIFELITVACFIKIVAEKCMDASDETSEKNGIYKLKVIDIARPLASLIKKNIPQVLNILSAYFENDGKKSFWERPLFKKGPEYFLVLNSSINLHIYNLFDSWIDSFPNFDKGAAFENYVKEEIKQLSKKKGFFVNVSDTKKYKANGETQEIDLVWELKDSIVIGECKCIRYPFSSRNVYASNSIIQKAIKQVNDKTNFLLKNQQAFPNLRLSKKVIKCVITNYPLYTGLVQNDVPIIDFRVISSYIDLGYNGAGTMECTMGKQVNKEIFYKNEDEFSRNLSQYITKPSAVETIKKYLKLQPKEIELFPGLTIIAEDAVCSEKYYELLQKMT